MPATDEDGAEAGNALIGLAERVEALEGPDREVDAEIAETYWRYNCRNPIWDCGPVAAYTASLDAAMSLVPEGFCIWQMGEVPDNSPRAWFANLWAEGKDEPERICEAATAALALTAAALRAIAGEAEL